MDYIETKKMSLKKYTFTKREQNIIFAFAKVCTLSYGRSQLITDFYERYCYNKTCSAIATRLKGIVGLAFYQ